MTNSDREIMHRIGRGTNKNVLPIFGNRKRQRQAMFADSIDFANNDPNDDSLFVDDDMLADKAQSNFNSFERCNNQQNINQNNQPSYQNIQSSRNIPPNRGQSQFRENHNTNKFNHIHNSNGNNNNRNKFNGNNQAKGSFRNDPTQSSTQNRTVNFQQSSQNHFPNESFDLPSQMRPFSSDNVNMASTPRNSRSSGPMRNQMNKSNFSSQNLSINDSRNRFASQTQSMGGMKNSSSSSYVQSNNQSSFSNQSMNVNNKSRNSFQYSNQKISGGKSSSSNPVLGTLPPPSKNMKTSFNNRSTLHKENRNNNQQNQGPFTHNDRSRQFSNQQSRTSNHQSLSSTVFNNNEADAVVPESKVEKNSPPKLIIKKQCMTTKLITSTISGLEKWRPVLDKTLVMFELCGHLTSPIPYNIQTNEKVFTISDGTGELRCVFWEIDRELPQLSRGATVRCVGKLHDDYFHCLSIRNIKPRETQLLKKMIEKSNKCLLKEMAELTSR